jgi:hypothetical protein
MKMSGRYACYKQYLSVVSTHLAGRYFLCVHNRSHESSPLDIILNTFNRNHIVRSYFFEVFFFFYPSAYSTSLKWSCISVFRPIFFRNFLFPRSTTSRLCLWTFPERRAVCIGVKLNEILCRQWLLVDGELHYLTTLVSTYLIRIIGLVVKRRRW